MTDTHMCYRGRRTVVRNCQSLPPIVRRQMRLPLVLAAIVVALIIVIIWLDASGIDDGVSGLAMVTVAGIMFLGCSAHMSFGPRPDWLSTSASACAFRLCGQCGQQLRGLPARCTCPECGHAYDLARLEQYWRKVNARFSAHGGHRGWRPSGGRRRLVYSVIGFTIMVLCIAASTGGILALSWYGYGRLRLNHPAVFLIVGSIWMPVLMLVPYAYFALPLRARRALNGHRKPAPHWYRDVVIPSRRAWNQAKRTAAHPATQHEP